MTVTNSTARGDYNCNGSTQAFSIPFQFFLPGEIQVIKTDTTVSPAVVTTLALTADYTVSGGAGSTGTFTTVATFPTGIKLSVLPNLPFTQQAHYVPNDPFPAETHEQALDRLDMQDIQLNEKLGRAAVLPPTVAGVNPALPVPTANAVLMWDPTATFLTNGTSLGAAAYETLNPAMDGAASPGVRGTVSRGDHVHPAPLASVIPYTAGWTNAVAGTQATKNAERISIFDFLSAAQKADVLAGTALVDCTAAINNALAYIQNIAAAAFGSNRFSRRPELYFPQGIYMVSGTLAITTGKFGISGDGSWASVIYQTNNSAVTLDLGTFTATPSDIFAGPQDIYMKGIRLQNSSLGTLGSRTGQGIRQMGGGGLRFYDVACMGFLYGVNSVCGGDFMRYEKVMTEFCDVGMYFGPGTAQTTVTDCNPYSCQNGIVMDGVQDIVFDHLVLNNHSSASVLIERISATQTRQLTSFTFSSNIQMRVVFNSPWFESNAGGVGINSIPTYHIQLNNNSVTPYSGMVVNNPYVNAGTDGSKTTTAFMGTTGTGVYQNIIINNLIFNGTMTEFFKGANLWTLNGYKVASGSPTTPLLTDNNSGLIYQSSDGTAFYQSSFPVQKSYNTLANVGGSGEIRVNYEVNGLVSFDYQNAGTYLNRFGFDIQNRRLFLDSPSANGFSLSRGSALPGSGTYTQGSFLFNLSAANASGKIQVGWQRVTTGSGQVLNTDWYPVYADTGLAANSSSAPGNPAGTTSTTAVMMGLAGAITPSKSGTITGMITGQMANNTVNDGVTVQVRTGTGSVPTNGAALTGTQRGNSQTHISLVAADTTGFCIPFVITGLAIGTAVWIDAALAAVTGGTASLTGVTITALEL